MQAGRLRHRVQIQSVAETPGPTGTTRVWSTDATRWASIKPRNVEAQPADGDTMHVITLRDYSGLTDKNRILFGSRVFNIASITDIEERGREIQILAVEKTQNA